MLGNHNPMRVDELQVVPPRAELNLKEGLPHLCWWEGHIPMGCPTVKVFILLVTIPLVGNVGRVGGFPPALEGTDTTGTEGCLPAIESMG